jgi:hypothetical protein
MSEQGFLKILGLDINDYYGIIENIGRMMNLSQGQRDNIINQGNEEIEPHLIGPFKELRKYLEYDRQAYLLEGLHYEEGPPIGLNLFTSAIFDYLSRSFPEDAA